MAIQFIDDSGFFCFTDDTPLTTFVDDLGNFLSCSPPFGSTTTILSSSLNPSTYLSAVTFTAVVSGTGSTPTGTVTFFNEGSDISGPVALISGTTTFTTAAIASGVHIITAVYSGDGTFAASTSSQLDQLVTPPGVPWIAAARGRLWRRGIR